MRADTYMVDSPTETPEKTQPARPHAEEMEVLGRRRSEKGGGELEREGGVLDTPGGWRSHKWEEECRRLEGGLVFRDWSLSRLLPLLL